MLKYFNVVAIITFFTKLFPPVRFTVFSIKPALYLNVLDPSAVKSAFFF